MVSQTIIRQLQDIVGKDRCLTAAEDLMVYSHDVFCESKPDVVVLPAKREEVSQVLQLANQGEDPRDAPGLGFGVERFVCARSKAESSWPCPR